MRCAPEGFLKGRLLQGEPTRIRRQRFQNPSGTGRADRKSARTPSEGFQRFPATNTGETMSTVVQDVEAPKMDQQTRDELALAERAARGEEEALTLRPRFSLRAVAC